MNMSFYTAAVGARQQQLRLDVQAHNIANVNTYGYKAQKPSFSSLMYGNILGIDQEELPRGTGAVMSMAEVDSDTSGHLADTGRSQDYAIVGDGYFGLYDPVTGEVSYTRDGSFIYAGYQRPNDDGELEQVYMLSDGLGRFVLNDRGALLEVTGDDPDKRQPVGVFDFVNTDGFVRLSDNRYIPVDKNGQVRFGTGTAQQYALESSNTDLAEQITKVIEAQRSFTYALKMVQTSDELESTTNGLRT